MLIATAVVGAWPVGACELALSAEVEAALKLIEAGVENVAFLSVFLS
jgi:hypothetical protein